MGKRTGKPRGRPPGAKNKHTKEQEALSEEIRRKALEQGKTPLEVMLEAMRQAYLSGGPIVAMAFAKEAAPYLHPKLSSVEAALSGAVGQYTAQPVPVEEREPIRKPNGHS